MVKTVNLVNYSDIHFTNDVIAMHIVRHFDPVGSCLEPFRGGGAFHKWLPKGASWCEIDDGVDFFRYSDPVDWIVTNPPFSNMTKVFEHAFMLAENCVFLIPISKYWSSNPRIKLAKSYGGLKEIFHVGTGREIGFNTGFPFAAMHFQRAYSGAIRETHLSERINGVMLSGSNTKIQHDMEVLV